MTGKEIRPRPAAERYSDDWLDRTFDPDAPRAGRGVDGTGGIDNDHAGGWTMILFAEEDEREHVILSGAVEVVATVGGSSYASGGIVLLGIDADGNALFGGLAEPVPERHSLSTDDLDEIGERVAAGTLVPRGPARGGRVILDDQISGDVHVVEHVLGEPDRVECSTTSVWDAGEVGHGRLSDAERARAVRYLMGLPSTAEPDPPLHRRLLAVLLRSRQ